MTRTEPTRLHGRCTEPTVTSTRIVGYPIAPRNSLTAVTALNNAIAGRGDVGQLRVHTLRSRPFASESLSMRMGHHDSGVQGLPAMRQP